MRRDYELSGHVVWGTATLGLDHNRWHVMGLVGSMLRDAADAAHVQQIGEALEQIPKHQRATLGAYLGHIPSALGDLF